MKVFISVDMEGISGVVHSAQVNTTNTTEYPRFRRLMTQDANAAVEGALAGGATEVVVSDSHGWMINIIAEDLHPKARLVGGATRDLCQMQGIDASFGAVLFIGYHAQEGGGDGVLNHTLIGTTVFDLRLNGQLVDEALLNAGVAGHFGVPVAMISGDNVVCQDALERIGPVETAVTKQAIDRYAAICLPVRESQDLIRQKARRAVERAKQGEFRPTRPVPPYTFEVTFKRSTPAHVCALFPGVERKDSRTIAITHSDYVAAFRHLWGCLIVGKSTLEGAL